MFFKYFTNQNWHFTAMHGLAAHSNWKQPSDSERQPQQLNETSNTADGDDYSGHATVDNFFDFGDQTAEPEQSNAHLEFLNDKDRDLSMLNRHQEVKQLFLRYNTALSSGVEKTNGFYRASAYCC